MFLLLIFFLFSIPSDPTEILILKEVTTIKTTEGET